MATAKKVADSFRGRLGDTVIYELNGQLIKRRIGKQKNNPSKAQLAVRAGTTLVANLLKPLKPFINAGFELETKNTTLNPYNKATSLNKLNAIKGVYPNQEIDYTKVILSKGEMPVYEFVNVERTKDGLVFTWDTSEKIIGTKPTDRIMVVAYCPEKNFAVYSIDNVRRNEGTEIVKLPKYKDPYTVYVYSAFVSADKKAISNSIYLGNF